MLELTSAEVADLVRTTLLPILFVVVVAVIATRLASSFVHGAWAPTAPTPRPTASLRRAADRVG